MGRAADFFVSYTSADRAWAEWIAWQLEADGYQVVVQAWDFGPGRDWSHEMHRGTSTAGRVVVVLSPAYLESAHGEAEWRVFYAEDPSGERRLLLPVRVGEVDPPGLLKGRVYVDLVRQMRPVPGERFLPRLGANVRSQPARQDFQEAGGPPSVLLRRPGSRRNFRRPGTCHITLTPSSRAVSHC